MALAQTKRARVDFRGEQSEKLTRVLVKRKDFIVAECITHPVSAAEREDLTGLEKIWMRSFDKHKVTPEDKQAALEHNSSAR